VSCVLSVVHAQIPGAVTTSTAGDITSTIPVELAGWLVRRLDVPADRTPWCLVVTNDQKMRLAVSLLVRGPLATSVVCGLSHLKLDPGSKEVLDRIITDVAIPGARALDGLMEVKWAQEPRTGDGKNQ
jgi:hypothetical protein